MYKMWTCFPIRDTNGRIIKIWAKKLACFAFFYCSCLTWQDWVIIYETTVRLSELPRPPKQAAITICRSRHSLSRGMTSPHWALYLPITSFLGGQTFILTTEQPLFQRRVWRVWLKGGIETDCPPDSHRGVHKILQPVNANSVPVHKTIGVKKSRFS